MKPCPIIVVYLQRNNPKWMGTLDSYSFTKIIQRNCIVKAAPFVHRYIVKSGIGRAVETSESHHWGVLQANWRCHLCKNSTRRTTKSNPSENQRYQEKFSQFTNGIRDQGEIFSVVSKSTRESCTSSRHRIVQRSRSRDSREWITNTSTNYTSSSAYDQKGEIEMNLAVDKYQPEVVMQTGHFFMT